jgi:hypothetical protein
LDEKLVAPVSGENRDAANRFPVVPDFVVNEAL